MSDTLRRGTGSRKYRQPRSVRQDGALGRYVTEGGSRSLAGAHAKELRTWTSARQFIACYAPARALRAVQSLMACIASVVRAVTPARLVEADTPDRLEDSAQTRYLIDRTPASRETYIRALAAEMAADADLIRDLQAQPPEAA